MSSSRNIAYRRRRDQSRRSRIQKFLTDAKRKPCADCGAEYHPYVMDFDHVRGDKCMTLGSARQNYGTVGWDKLREEIAKCDVVCANCHRIRTLHKIVLPSTSRLA